MLEILRTLWGMVAVAWEYLRALVLFVVRPLPRIVLLGLISLIAVAAIFAVAAPEELICSAYPKTFGCGVIALAAPHWLENMGTWIGNAILCSIVKAACNGGMQSADTQAAFQAVFGFTIILNVLQDVWANCRTAFQDIPKRLRRLNEDILDSEGESVDAAVVEARERRWCPTYSRIIRYTYLLIWISYVITAIVSGCIVISMFATKALPLPYTMPAAIIFSTAPFIMMLLLQFDRFIAERVVVVAIAPEHYWRQFWTTLYQDRLVAGARGRIPARVASGSST